MVSRVLLAEDVLSNAAWEQLALEALSCEVCWVGDGAAAAALARVDGFDLILMDYRMPVMDGVAATHAIRAFEAAHRRRRVPIIALTASAMPAERQCCLDAGMDDVLVKPVLLDDLQRVVDRWAASPVSDSAACS